MIDKKTKILSDLEPLERNELHEAIIAQFGSVNKASNSLGVCKETIYAWIHKNEVPKSSRKRVELLGYSADDFTSL